MLVVISPLGSMSAQKQRRHFLPGLFFFFPLALIFTRCWCCYRPLPFVSDWLDRPSLLRPGCSIRSPALVKPLLATAYGDQPGFPDQAALLRG